MKPEVKSILYSFIPGFILVTIISIIKYYEVQSGTNFAAYGLFPRSVPDLRGIITFPLIHKDYDHLFSNAIPLFILMAMLRYFYREVSLKVFLLTWILGGLWLWLGGRASYHIGASGLVYGLSSFIFFSGIWRKERRMMAVSLIVVFLYGGMVWGIFPWFKETSWEGHLFGGLAGLLLSWVYRKEGPQRIKYQWEDEPDESDNLEIGEFENLKMGGFEGLKMGDIIESGLKDGEEEMELEDGEELKKSQKTVGKDLFDLSSPKITYEYIEPKKDDDRNADDRDLKDPRG